ncbi:pyridoxamine 5'-phosphate oxidase family protein [Spiractinospora alimapuensis]|uniref:pyridoxamine 5'-phosphate oxidase family protein n=1 Tax=Spiractinospora alimapuensis TaxID=2820884 RepID=UPI001F42F677|nr:pyridoxamine 5'-phosphate oxidase family protein [Spiractinospora alimapuensis]QVQ53171.1 pyridoxamine 5'-phosphate oxidase family protein [Spiractinospora alimapuensis]
MAHSVTAGTEITTEAELREVIPEPIEAAWTKERASLSPTDRMWLAHSPFCLVATADAQGNCDVSPKGDPAGSLAHVLDDSTIAIPERPGNRRVDSLRNILENPHVGMVFVVPGRGDTLRINGRARLVRDAPFLDDMVVKGHRPPLAVVVDIDTIYHHCAKAFMRSDLWNPESWRPDAIPTRAQLAKRLERPEESLENLELYYGPGYAKYLY